MLDSWMAKSDRLRSAQACAAAIAYGAGMGARMATVAAAAAGVLSGLAFARGHEAAGLIELWISAALDAVDGTIARDFEAPTAFGGVLDLTSDRLVEAAALLGLAWYRPAL